jgi:DUF1009 family protein
VRLAAPVTVMAEPLGLIAGNGRFPFLVAAAAGVPADRVVAVAIREEAAPELAARWTNCTGWDLGSSGVASRC